MSGNSKVRIRSGPGRGFAAVGAFAFSCGVILLYRLSILPPSEWILASLVGAVCLFWRSRQPWIRYVAALGLVFLFGASWAGWQASQRLGEQLPAGLEGQRLVVSGYLCAIPSPGHFRSLRFSVCVTQWHDQPVEATLPTRLRLAWYGQDDPRLPSHRLRLEVVLKRPHGTLNDVGFRYEDWLLRKGFRATGSVRGVVVDDSVPCPVLCQYHAAHAGLARWVEQRFAGAENLPLIRSLLVGDRGHLDASQWQVLKATGTIHLVAISGLHLGLIALGAGFLARRLLMLLPVGWWGEQSQRRTLFVTVSVCCLVYALMAGFTVPTQRALVMVVIGGWALLLAHQRPAWHGWVWALTVALLLDPFAPLDQGFWLSFGAVAVLLWSFSGRLRAPHWFSALLIAQVTLFATLWPLLLMFGQDQPLIGGLANLVAIPLVSLVVMPVLLVGALSIAIWPPVSAVMVPVCDSALTALWALLTALASAPTPAIVAEPPEIALLALLLLALVRVPGSGARIVSVGALMLWLALALWHRPQISNPDTSEPEMRVWDVGQGLAVLVRHGRRVLLYDTGPALDGVFSAVESTLLPGLRALDVAHIDTLVISHADSDHSGGLALLAEAVSIGKLITGEVDAVRAKLGAESGITLLGCNHPTEAFGALQVHYWGAGEGFTGNDASCVVRIVHGPSKTEWLLPGDIGSGIEALAVRDMPGLRRQSPEPVVGVAGSVNPTRVVLAPHHGSKTSSSPLWVQALDPDLVIYSAGYRHRYGHPHPAVTARYRGQGSQGYSTACSGMLTLTIDENRLTIHEQRQDVPFWIGGIGQTRDECAIP